MGCGSLISVPGSIGRISGTQSLALRCIAPRTTALALPLPRSADTYGTRRIIRFRLVDSRPAPCSINLAWARHTICLALATRCCAADGGASTTIPASLPAGWMLLLESPRLTSNQAIGSEDLDARLITEARRY